jgi:hypothetical protein
MPVPQKSGSVNVPESEKWLMSATATRTRSWPTIAEIEEAVEALHDAEHALDEFGIRCSGLIERESPWEKPEGTPVPSLADIGALTRLVDNVEWTIQQLSGELERLRQLQSSASTFAAPDRPTRERRGDDAS